MHYHVESCLQCDNIASDCRAFYRGREEHSVQKEQEIQMLSLRRSKNKVIPKFAAVWSHITSVVETLMLQLNVSTDLRMNNGFARRASCSTLQCNNVSTGWLSRRGHPMHCNAAATDISGVVDCGLRPRATFCWNVCEVIGDQEQR